MSIVFDLVRTNQLSLLPEKYLVDLLPHIEPYQVKKIHISYQLSDVSFQWLVPVVGSLKSERF